MNWAKYLVDRMNNKVKGEEKSAKFWEQHKSEIFQICIKAVDTGRWPTCWHKIAIKEDVNMLKLIDIMRKDPDLFNCKITPCEYESNCIKIEWLFGKDKDLFFMSHYD